MRFMIMHKTSAHWEAGAKPTLELVQRVGGMIGELQRAGVMLAGEGLAPSAQGARVRLTKGDRTVTPGPISREGALPARYAIFRAGTVDQAADIAARFGKIFGDVFVDVRPVNEAWDLGFAEKPKGLNTRRYMAVVNASAASEAGTQLEPGQKAALKSFSEGLGDAFIAMEHFEPSARARRLGVSAKRVTVTDGPFSETKELIGGFVIVEVASIDDAVGWARKYVEAVEVEEVDVRGLAAP
jgi:hypothetical protein